MFVNTNLSFHRWTEPEEMTAKYHRILSGSLDALANLFIPLVPRDQQSSQLYQKLLGNPKFWKFAKHSVPNVSFPIILYIDLVTYMCWKEITYHLSD